MAIISGWYGSYPIRTPSGRTYSFLPLPPSEAEPDMLHVAVAAAGLRCLRARAETRADAPRLRPMETRPQMSDPNCSSSQVAGTWCRCYLPDTMGAKR